MNQSFDRNFDPYKTLGVKPDASADEIKQAYRRLAKKYHPDRCGGDKANESRFKDVTNAYEVLGDRDKRAQYDALRSGAGGMGGSPIDLGDLFAQIFGGGAAGGMGGMGGMGGGKSHYRVVNEPFGGGGGFGGFAGFGGDPFGGMGGGGTTTRTRRTAPAKPKAPAEKTIRAKDGSKLLQKGSNVYSDARIAFDQAVLGTVVKVSTIDGTASVKIPPGTSSGAKLRLKGKGPKKSDGTRGNHMVTVHIDVPKDLDEDAKKLLAQFMSKIR